MSGIVSTFSYVVNLLPHSSHERLLLIEFLSSAGRESITLVSGFPQYGHLMSISAFLFPFSICAIIIPHALKFLQKFFFFNLHKHDIRTDLFYAGKGNHIFTICPEKSAYFPRSGYYDRLDFSCTYVDLHICDTAETPSAAYIDHFFFLQFTDPHTASPPFYALLNLLYERTVPPCTKPQSISLSFFQFMRYNNISKTNKNIFI